MTKRFGIFTLMAFILMLIMCKSKVEEPTGKPSIYVEKTDYYKHPKSDKQLPFKYRLEYYHENGNPHRWQKLDSTYKVLTDYIYQYDNTWKHTGALYSENSDPDYGIEKVRFENDSTQITEWIDSIGAVYYTMTDNLNKAGKTYRAEFKGDEIHGYDSTFYTKEGFVERIFFTNIKGKVFNDRQFEYDEVNEYGDWISRRKIMNDTIRELQIREIIYRGESIPINAIYDQKILGEIDKSE